MEIKNGFISAGQNVRGFEASPNIGKRLKPEMVIMHFTGGKRVRAAINWLKNPKSSASAHFVVDQEGFVTQLVSCDKIAWHAGQSVWGARSGVNGFSIGIELINSGILSFKSGKYLNATGDEVPESSVVTDVKGRYWECFTEVQIQTAVALVRAIMQAYPSVTEIAGHEDVAPKRKLDPGPAFPWQVFQGIENLSVRGRMPVKPQNRANLTALKDAAHRVLSWVKNLI